MKKILFVFFLVGIFIGTSDASPTNAAKVKMDNGKDVIAVNDATAVMGNGFSPVIPIANDIAIRGPSFTQFVTFELSNSQPFAECGVKVDQKMITNEMTRYTFSENTYNWNIQTTKESKMLIIRPHNVAMPSKACTTDSLVMTALLPQESLIIASQCNALPLKLSMTNVASGFENDGLISERSQTNAKSEFAG